MLDNTTVSRLLVLTLAAVLALGARPGHALGWSAPVDGPLLAPFAAGADPYAGGQHRGVDLAAAEGTPVVAPAAGIVRFAGSVPSGGRTVSILTPDGYVATLLHLGGLLVARGDVVEEGAPVATAGRSGDPEHDRPSVHFGVRIASDPHGYVDPLLVLRPGSAGEPAAAEPAETGNAQDGEAGTAPSVAEGDLEAPAEAPAVQAVPPAPTAGSPAPAVPGDPSHAGEGAPEPAAAAPPVPYVSPAPPPAAPGATDGSPANAAPSAPATPDEPRPPEPERAAVAEGQAARSPDDPAAAPRAGRRSVVDAEPARPGAAPPAPERPTAVSPLGAAGADIRPAEPSDRDAERSDGGHPVLGAALLAAGIGLLGLVAAGFRRAGSDAGVERGRGRPPAEPPVRRTRVAEGPRVLLEHDEDLARSA